jgi:hypothetical protein
MSKPRSKKKEESQKKQQEKDFSEEMTRRLYIGPDSGG